MADLIDLFKSCDSTNQAAAKAISDKDKVVAEQQALLSATSAQLSQAKGRGIFESPILWFAVGALLTGYVVHLTK